MKLEDFIKKHGNVSVNEGELKELLGIENEKYFIPKDGEVYFFVRQGGYIGRRYDVGSYGVEICENNEVFRTEEEAKEHARKQRFLLQMKRDFLDNSDEIDWEDDTKNKYNIHYSKQRNCILVDGGVTVNYGTPVTTNKEWLEEYIEKHEEEIKRYCFGIKEEK